LLVVVAVVLTVVVAAVLAGIEQARHYLTQLFLIQLLLELVVLHQ
jgi:hypothetical protein